MKKMLFLIVGIVLLGSIIIMPAFRFDTCGNSEEEISTFLEERQQHNVSLKKISKNDRIMAVIYDREDLGTCVAVFEKKLFGLRYKYDGMDGIVDNGLQANGSWNEGYLKSKCDIVICGDNRNGTIKSYVMEQVPDVARNDIEADFILDIYILDGIDFLPDRLTQYTRNGDLFL